MHWIRNLLAVMIAAMAAAAVWWGADRPQPVAAEWRQPLASLSFAPFRHGQSPLSKTYPTPRQVEADLTELVGRTRSIRTYSAREGMEVVPALAARLGLTVTFGAWLGSDPAVNDAELTALINAANRYPETITRVIVGNEVLLRRDLPPDQLIAAIRRVKAAIRQPVSTADVWAFYLKHPEVVGELDYLTIHILPFWEDEPVAVDRLEPFVVGIVARIRQAFPGKALLIGETGWPSLGRDRGAAVVDVVEEASFVRQMANIAARHDFDYNIVEAFDQPWKAALENTVGAAWGILDEARQPKFLMTGPVLLVADWPMRAGWALLLGAVAALLLGRRLRSFAAALSLALMAQILAWLLITTLFHVVAVTFQPWQQLWLLLRIGLPTLLFVALLGRCRDWLAVPALARPGTTARDRWLGRPLMVGAALYAVGWSLLLLLDGRYRDIPEIDFSLPVAGVLLLLGLRQALLAGQGVGWQDRLAWNGLWPGGMSAVPRLLAWALPLAAAMALLSEGLAVIGEDFRLDHPTLMGQLPVILRAVTANREMDLWAAMLLAWSVPFLAARRIAAVTAADPA